MGPKSTLDFLNKIISLTPAKKDQKHLKIFVYINPQIPDRTEAIIGDGTNPLQTLVDSAKILENAGAHFIVIPCVTAHFWLADLQNSINIPILDIVEISLKKIKKETKSIKKIGMLATTGVIQSGIFKNVFEPEGYKIIVPSGNIQRNYVMKGIYDIKRGVELKRVKSLFLYACDKLIKNLVEVILLACTEIPLVITQNDIPIPLFDVNEILAAETVRFALASNL